MARTQARTLAVAPSKPRPWRSRMKTLIRSGVLLGLLGLTAWQVLRRPAQAEAQAAFARRDFATALRRSQDDLARHPSSRVSALIAARCLSQMIYADQAERLYDIARQGGELPLEAQRDRASGLFTANRFDQAATACDAILKTHPDDIPTLTLLSLLEFTRGRYAEGVAAAERLAKVPGGEADGLALLAMNHHAARHPDQAVAACEALLAMDPEVKTYKPGAPIFWFEYAEDLLALQRPAEVRDLLTKRVIGEHFEPYLLDVLGTSLKMLEDYDGAEARWRESLRRDPTQLNPWVQLGRLYNQQKRFDEAAKMLERAVAIEPDHLDSHFLLSTAYKYLNRPEDAAREAARADELRRKSPAANTGMGASP